MIKKLFLIYNFLFASLVAFGQVQGDFPSSLNYFLTGDEKFSNQICDNSEVKHREVVSETFGREFYCNGNLQAIGPIKKLKSEIVIYPERNNEKVLITEFIRNGDWKVYFDSTTQ